MLLKQYFTKDKSIILWASVLGFLLTVGLLFETYREIRRHDFAAFQNETENIRDTLADHIRSADEALHNIATLFTVSPVDIDSDGFRLIAESILAQQPTAMHLSFARWVPAREKESFEAQNWRASGVANFKILTDTKTKQRPQAYLPLVFLEPLTPKTISYLGVDLLSTPTSKVHIQEAISTGKTIASQLRVRDQVSGFTLNRALYSGKKTPTTPAQRRQNVLGVLRILLNSESLVSPWKNNQTLDIQLVGPGSKVLVQNHLKPLRSSFLDGNLESHIPVKLLDSVYYLRVKKRIPFNATRGLVYFTALLVGIAISVLVAYRIIVFLRSQQEIRERQAEVEKKVLEKTKALRESELLLRQVIDSNPNLIFAQSESGKILFANKTFFETLNYRPQDIYEKETQYPLPGQFLEVGTARQEKLYLHEGGFKWFESTRLPLEVENQERCYLTVAVDISQRKCNEAVIAEQRAQIFSSAKLSSLGEMAGGIAHEINNPLTTIKLLSGQILNKLKGETIDQEVITKHAMSIERTTDRIAKIVRGLRAISRDGSLDQMAPFCLVHAIEETLAVCREKFRHSGVDIECDFPSQLEIIGREVQISQVLLNLLNNAFDAVQESQEPLIRIRASSTGQTVRLSVEDNGSGISKIAQEKLFQPFFTTKEVGKGTGLGLSISKGIVESHGGNLYWDSKSLFTRFVMEFPAPAQRKTVATSLGGSLLAQSV